MRKKSLSAKKRNYRIIADNLTDKRINNIFKLFENNLRTTRKSTEEYWKLKGK